METMADKSWFKSVESFRRSHAVKFWGEIFVMIGVFGEIIVSGATAINEWKNNPLNAPINSISVVANLKLKGFKESQHVLTAWDVFDKPSPPLDTMIGDGRISFFRGTNIHDSVINLISGKTDMQFLASGLVGGPDDCRGLIVRLHEPEDMMLAQFMAKGPFKKGVSVGAFNDVRSLVIILPKFATNISVVSGTIDVKANDQRWEFPIPAQKTRDGIITSEITKRAFGTNECKVFKVLITDWMLPPRFPNYIYTGQ